MQTSLQEQHIAATAQHRFNHLILDLTGSMADSDYEDLSGADDLGPIPFQDVNDYLEREIKLRGTYKLKPELSVFAEGAAEVRLGVRVRR
ncbi:MAG: outer membrane beta-barrel protein [Methyloceanibacter sp.]